ncbi:MAG: AraC family transcriptional regulator [Clostridia bacterium]|nr:AraC family transcriptional regulator [Clostridia bacterium]
MNYYYAKGRVNTDKQSEAALTVNNCGYYRDLGDPIEINRPNGRGDYQLLLCINGNITVSDELLERGDLYLFLPHQKQVYTYHATPDSFYCWVHFTGYEVSALLEKSALSQGKHSAKSRLSDLESLFRLMALELGRQTLVTDTLAAGLLCSVLMMVADSKVPLSPFPAAIKRLDELGDRVTVEELANMYKMSKGHFIRLFRDHLGISPYQYRIQKQLELAKMLLSYSRLSISDITHHVGLDDPLYFSRLFKKHVGISPSQYRKRP